MPRSGLPSLTRYARVAGFCATLLGLLFVGAPAQATCGGGGGGGKGGAGKAYETTWAPSISAAFTAAARDEQGVVLYFMPQGATSVHPFFTTKMASDWSKQRRFVKIEHDGNEALRATYDVAGGTHTVHVCDWHGNSFKFYLGNNRGRLNSKGIRDVLFGAKKLAQKLEKDLAKGIKNAEKAIAKQSWGAAAKALRGVASLKGYAAADQARALIEDVAVAGDAQVDEALEIQDERARARKLKAIKKTFTGTRVEDRCEEELGKLSYEPADAEEAVAGRAPSLAERVWAELFGAIDYAALPLSTAERADAALRTGLAHEVAGRYEAALEAYAQAAGLDITDPLPLVFLGELHRHHLGRWDEARKVFDRVVELDTDDFASAVALHGLGKMTIWAGGNEAGLELFRRSIERFPTALCYRNLAVYWNTEGDAAKAFSYADAAYRLDPKDDYNQVFYSVYLLLNGQEERSKQLMAGAEFDVSMSYNYACFYAVQGERDKVMTYLKRHFQEYEQFDAVRAFEMGEARMDAFFRPWLKDADFVELTALAGDTPWLRSDR